MVAAVLVVVVVVVVVVAAEVLAASPMTAADDPPPSIELSLNKLLVSIGRCGKERGNSDDRGEVLVDDVGGGHGLPPKRP